MTITGGVGSGQSHVDIYLESRTCDKTACEIVAGPHTDDAGRFTVEIGGGINRFVRARAEGATSNVILIGQRPSLTLQQRPAGTFWFHVTALRSFWRKRAVLQRYDASLRNWRDVRSALLVKTGSSPGSPFVWSQTEKFRQQLPKRTLVRATLPLAQAKPCYLAGYSNLAPPMKRAVIASGLLAATAAGLAAAGVLADSITLQPRATVLRSDEYSVGVVGDISSGAEGEYVVVKGKECGIPGAFFRAISGGTTLPGGRYEASVPVRTRTTLRAEWKDATSAVLTVNKRADIRLTKEEDGFRVAVSSETQSMDGKRATIERFTGDGLEEASDRGPEVDVRLRPVRGEEEAPLQVPKGTTIRAVLARSQAGACYLAGYSKLIRT